MKQFLLGLGIVVGMVFLFIGASSFSPHPINLQGEYRIESGFTHSSTTLATTSDTVVLSNNSGRLYGRISNDLPSPVYCVLSETVSSTVSKGIRLDGIGNTTSSGASFIELGPGTNIDYPGQVRCICSAGTCRVTTLEK
jgi:hypothetical protein